LTAAERFIWIEHRPVVCYNEESNETSGANKRLNFYTTWSKLLAQTHWSYSSTITFTREPKAHWITMFNNIQPYKPLPLTPAQIIIRPTNWLFSQRLYSRYELCDCNTFSEHAGVPQHHFYTEQIRPKTVV